MNLTTIVEPPSEPVSLAEAYAFLRWDAETEMVGSPPEPEVVYPLGAMVQGHIKTARLFVEQRTRRALVQQTIRLSTGGWRGIKLLRPPFIRLVSVEYFNAAEDAMPVELDIADFYVTDDVVPRLQAYTRVVQACYDLARDRDDAIRVTYQAGYAPIYDDASPPEVTSYIANVPQDLKDAMLIHVQLLCDRFDAGEKADLERTRDSLLSSNTVHTF